MQAAYDLSFASGFEIEGDASPAKMDSRLAAFGGELSSCGHGWARDRPSIAVLAKQAGASLRRGCDDAAAVHI